MTAPLEVINRPGLEGVIAAETRLSKPNGQIGELFIAGFRLENIAPYATFEEMVYLLWNDALPTKAQLTAFSTELAANRELPPIAYDILRAAAEKKLPVMDALRMAAGTLNLLVEDDNAQATAKVAVASFPTIVAAYWRLLSGQEPITPRTDLSHAANYLYMLDGEVPSEERTRALEIYLNTVVDHGFNASTFTARIIVSTQSDVIAAVVGAIGALKGPLHGGAPGPALDMVFEIGTPERAEPVIRAKLERGERLMGFGHRVYKNFDPRAKVMKESADEVLDLLGIHDNETLKVAKELERIALEDPYFIEKKLYPNVDFYSGIILEAMGFPTSMFTPIFALSRAVGWIAQWKEMISDPELKIGRPRQLYTGAKQRDYIPVENR